MTDKRKDPKPTRVSYITQSPELFDRQAGSFDRRAGLPEDCCREIAQKAMQIAEAAAGDLIVEIGSGTGEIGAWFKAPLLYIGLDLSAGMLKQFQRRLDGDPQHRALVQADANLNWPLTDGAARVVFSSRAMHLLEPERVAAEVFRAASPAGATLILGRVEREPGSVKERMAQEMSELLRRRGFKGRRGERRSRKLIDACIKRGAQIIEPAPVAKWTVWASPRKSLDSWRSLTGLGGVVVPGAARSEILRALEVWAEEVFGSLDQEFESEETYVLTSLRLR